MYRLYFILALFLIFVFQCINGQEKSASNAGDEDRNINESCLGNENYCCNYVAVKANGYSEENQELLVNTSASLGDHILFGPLLIIISLLVLRAFSKRIEE